MKLYNYFRSSASFRVRIAMALKGLSYEYVPVHLARGDHKLPAYADIAAEGLVPLLELDDGTRLTQSMAIIEYLDETHPEPPLLPSDALGRARVRARSEAVPAHAAPAASLPPPAGHGPIPLGWRTLLRRGRGVRAQPRSRRRASVAMASAVMPKWAYSCSAGPLAPKPRMPSKPPRSPSHWSQPKRTAASQPTRTVPWPSTLSR